VEYKLEGYNLFMEMMAQIRRNVIYNVSRGGGGGGGGGGCSVRCGCLWCAGGPEGGFMWVFCASTDSAGLAVRRSGQANLHLL
jgi:hypothetical protein